MDDLAWLRFDWELRGMVRGADADGVLAYPVRRRASIKDVVEALGVPHTEIYGLAANGSPLPFQTLLGAGMTVEISGATFPVDVTKATVLRSTPYPRLAFAADANVGKLARLLRLLGFDTRYDPQYTDAALAEQGAVEGRVVVTRDRNCCKRSRIVYGLWIRANDPVAQLRRVMAVFGLGAKARPFTRCLCCNAELRRVEKAVVEGRLQPLTKRYYSDFSRCPSCERIYWAGTHHAKMMRLIEELAGGDRADYSKI